MEQVTQSAERTFIPIRKMVTGIYLVLVKLMVINKTSQNYIELGQTNRSCYKESEFDVSWKVRTFHACAKTITTTGEIA